MSTHRRALLIALSLLAAPAAAAPDPTAKCIASRVVAAGKEIDFVLRCHAKAASKGLAVDAGCVGRALDKAVSALTRATARGGCPATAFTDLANATDLLARTTAVGDRLRPPSGASSCQASKIKAAGKRAGTVLRLHANHARRPDAAKMLAGVVRAHTKFTEAMTKAELPGDCLAFGDAPEVAGTIDALMDWVPGHLKLVVRQSVSLPSPAEPADTPGSPSVPPSANPKLIAQFGSGTFDLNNATYTRWRLAGPVQTPDAILVTVPGFGGGAGNFEQLAENLIMRALEDHGLIVELWGYDRRTEQLEDRAGALLAGSLSDPLVALDWFYGAELGLTLHPALVSGPNRRAVFYNSSTDVPFIANWTPLTFSRDIDAVVTAARAIARNQNVFVGGHSAGTGFAARYAATDFNLSGVGPADPGYSHIRGVILFEGGGGTAATSLSADTLDRIEAKFDGGLFGAVRDAMPRCVDGTTPCTIATEATDCMGQVPPKCTPNVAAHGVILGLPPHILAAAEPGGVQGVTDPDTGQVILQVDQGAPGNNAIDVVPELALLGILPAGTVEGLFASFIDDEFAVVGALAASMGAVGPTVGGLRTWRDQDERETWPACPGVGCVTPNNGPPPVTLPGSVWGTEVEATRIDRLGASFSGIEGANSSDWYYPISGLSVTSVAGICSSGTCSVGDVGAPCTANNNCNQGVSLDSTPLSIGRGRRDIENLTQAGNVNIPFLNIGGSNGLVPVPGAFNALAVSLGACTAPSCNGVTPRVIDSSVPSPAFPTFGGVNAGFEVVIAEGFAHIDVVAAEDDADNPVVVAVSDFIARNAQ